MEMTTNVGPSWLEDTRRRDIERARAIVVPFGRHKGLTLGYVLDHDAQHLIWLESVAKKPELKWGVSTLWKYYAESIRRAQAETERARKMLWR